MITPKSQCLSESDLSYAFTRGGDDALYRHLAACANCRRQWEALDDLRDLASALSFPDLSAPRVEATRSALLDKVGQQAPRRPARRVSYMIPAVAAVAAALLMAGGGLVWWTVSAPSHKGGVAPAYLASVHAQSDAEYARVSGAPSEIVRLHEGRMTVAVPKLQDNQRLRVLTGDAEVEVRGTVFDVEARDDALVHVRVIEGVVEVRHGQQTVVLRTGERWDAQAVAMGQASNADKMPEAADGDRAPAPEAVGEELPAIDDGPAVIPSDTASTPVASKAASRPRARRVPRARAPRHTQPARVVEVVVPEREDDKAAPETSAPSESEIQFQTGWRAFEAGDHEAAASAFARVGAGAPALASNAAFWRAVALDRAGHSVEAEGALRDFLRAWPRGRRSGAARAMLGWKRLRAGDNDAAGHLFRAALNDPSPKVRDSARAGLAAVTHASTK